MNCNLQKFSKLWSWVSSAFQKGNYFFYVSVSRFPIVGGGMGVCPPPSYNFFENTPSKTVAPHGALPHLKMKPPHLKNNPPPPIWNMKHSSMKWLCKKKFIFSKFLVACRLIAGNFFIKWTSLYQISPPLPNQILRSPHPPCSQHL